MRTSIETIEINMNQKKSALGDVKQSKRPKGYMNNTNRLPRLGSEASSNVTGMSGRGTGVKPTDLSPRIRDSSGSQGLNRKLVMAKGAGQITGREVVGSSNTVTDVFREGQIPGSVASEGAAARNGLQTSDQSGADAAAEQHLDVTAGSISVTTQNAK